MGQNENDMDNFKLEIKNTSLKFCEEIAKENKVSWQDVCDLADAMRLVNMLCRKLEKQSNEDTAKKVLDSVSKMLADEFQALMLTELLEEIKEMEEEEEQ